MAKDLFHQHCVERSLIYLSGREHGSWELGRIIIFYLMSGQAVLYQSLLIYVFLIVTDIFFSLFILLRCKLLHVCLRNEFLIQTCIKYWYMLAILFCFIEEVRKLSYSNYPGILCRFCACLRAYVCVIWVLTTAILILVLVPCFVKKGLI